MATNELLQKRFIYGKASEWYGVNNANKQSNEEKYAKSIVFIKNDTNDKKGDAIFAQGAYFEMNNATDVENIINSYLKEGKNIDIAVDEDSKLVIGAVSLASIDKLAEEDKEKLVEAQAVKDALTTPVELTLTLKDGVASFAESFKTLEGGDKTATATTAVLKQGDIISFTNDGGLKISHATITQATDVKTTETLSTTDKSFDTVSYSVDAYGHVTGKTINTVTLPDTAFSDTTYSAGTGLTLAAGNVFNHTNKLDAANTETKSDVTLGGEIKTFDFDQYSYDTEGHITGKVTNVVTLPDTAFVNDNTTYTGENAIDVAQPEEGSTQGKVTLKIDENEKVLTQSASGLKTNLAIDYISSTNKIRLTNGTDMISEFDASAFVKDSFLKNVEIVEENAEKVKGNYLKFTFETVDNDGTGESVDSTKVIYVDIKDFYVKTTVSKDDDTYTSVTKTGDDYKVSNVLGTISRNNDSNVITVSKDGLATVVDIKAVLETIDSDLDAVKAEGANKDEIAVVTGITQVDGKITAVDSGLAATKAYVDGVIDGLDSEVTAEDSKYFTKIVITNGKLDVTNSTVANVDKATLVDYQTKSTEKYVGLTTTDTIHGAFAKCEEAWDWGTI